MPGYPASMSALPQPMLVPAPWRVARVVAAVLCFVAMVLTVIALFVPLYSGEISTDISFGPSQSVEMTYTPWSVEYDDPAMNANAVEVPQVGYPIVFAVVILAIAACVCWYAATPSAGRTAGRGAGIVTAVAGAFLVGTVWTIALLVTNAIDTILMFGTLSQGIATDANYLVGYWLLLVATLLGFVAAVLALVPARQRVWQPPEEPFGFGGPRPHPMALMASARHREPAAGQPAAYAVDPMTGQLLPGPPVAPFTSVDPLTGEPLQPSTPVTSSVDPLTGQPIPRPLPFTPDPIPLDNPIPPNNTTFPVPPNSVPLTNPTPSAPSGNGVPVPLPESPAPSTPEPPRGPAVPDSEDPLAEPPRR